MKKQYKKLLTGMFLLAFAFLFHTVPVLAAPGDPWDLFRQIMSPILVWIGAVMVILGCVEMGFAFRGDDAEGKRKGMMVGISGTMTLSLGLFLRSGFIGPATTPYLNPTEIDNDEMRKMINQIASWIPMLGLIVTIWGCVELIKAFKSDDAGGKQKALTIVVSGVALILIIPMMRWILFGTPLG